MTLNEVNIIKNSVLDATEAYVDARLNSSDFVKTQIGVTSGDPTEGSDGKYRHVVVCNKTAYTAGVTYRNVLSVGNVKFPANSVVFLIAPNAQYSNQFILGKLDNTPANIVGGTIKIGRIGNTDDYYFTVNETGNVTIKGANSSIKLAQDGTTNYYHVNLDKNGIKLGHTGTGDTYNFTVDATTGATTIRNGSINLNYNSTVSDYGIKLNSSGIYLGVTGTSSSNKAYNFTVSSAGAVTIKSGSINLTYNSSVSDYNFKVDSTGIKLGVTGTTSSNKAYNFVVNSSGVVTIKSGSINLSYNSTVSDYNFKVDSSGIYLGVTGTSSSNKAYNFTVNSAGTVAIRSGSLNLSYNSTLQDYNVKISSSGIYLGLTGTTTTDKSYKFSIDSSGNLTAKYITADVGGSIGGWTIDTTNGLKSSQGHNGVCTLYPHTIKIAKFGTNKSSGASALLGLDVANERIVVNSDSGQGSIIVSNNTGWDGSGGITNPEQGVYTKLSPAAVTLHNSDGSATVGWNGAKFLNNCEDQGIQNLRIYVGSSHIGFYAHGKVASLNLT